MKNTKLFIPGTGPLANALRQVLADNLAETPEAADAVIITNSQELFVAHPGNFPEKKFAWFAPGESPLPTMEKVEPSLHPLLEWLKANVKPAA